MAEPTLYTKILQELEEARTYARLAQMDSSGYSQELHAKREKVHRLTAIRLLKELP